MLPKALLTQVNGPHLAACGPLPVTMGKCVQPARSTAVQQLRPSVTTLLPAAKSRLASSLLDLLLAETFDDRQPQPAWLALGRRLDRRHERGLAGGTAAALAARACAAEIGVVDLDPTRELGLVGLARLHRRHQLLLHHASSARRSAAWCPAAAPARPTTSRLCFGSGGRSPETTWSAAAWSSGTPSRRSGRPGACNGCTSRASGSSARRSGRGRRPGTPSLCPSGARTAQPGIAPRCRTVHGTPPRSAPAPVVAAHSPCPSNRPLDASNPRGSWQTLG